MRFFCDGVDFCFGSGYNSLREGKGGCRNERKHVETGAQGGRARVCARGFLWGVCVDFCGCGFVFCGCWMFPGFCGYFGDSTTYYMAEEGCLWLVGRVLM